jgi:hypothetical protein
LFDQQPWDAPDKIRCWRPGTALAIPGRIFKVLSRPMLQPNRQRTLMIHRRNLAVRRPEEDAPKREELERL